MMAKRLKSIDDIRPNMFEAIKRAYIKMGFVPRPKDPKPEHKSIRPEALNDQAQLQEKSERARAGRDPEPDDETYPERVAGGESDKSIESEGDKNDRRLKSQAEGSKAAKGPETLPELAAKSEDVLYESTTVFPFTLFPDTITLDREKLTMANRFFWRTAKITSVPVGEIMSCEANVGPFFGSLHFTFRFFANNERTISFLPRNDALEMQRLVHGYIIAHRREIDVSSVSKEKLVNLLSELGQGVPD